MPYEVLGEAEFDLLRRIFLSVNDHLGAVDIQRLLIAALADAQAKALLFRAGIDTTATLAKKLDKSGSGKISWLKFKSYCELNVFKQVDSRADPDEEEDSEDASQTAIGAAFAQRLQPKSSAQDDRIGRWSRQSRQLSERAKVAQVEAMYGRGNHKLPGIASGPDATRESLMGTSARGEKKATALRTLKRAGVRHIMNKSERTSLQNFFKVSDSILLGRRMMDEWHKKETLAQVSSKWMQAGASSGVHDDEARALQTYTASKYDSVRVAAADANHYMKIEKGCPQLLGETAHSRWHKKQRRWQASVHNTWLYGPKHVHYAEAGGKRIEITKEKSELALMLQRVWRGKIARRHVARVWSNHTQRDLRGIYRSLRAGQRREQRRLGTHVTQWARTMLELGDRQLKKGRKRRTEGLTLRDKIVGRDLVKKALKLPK